ncbi:MAG: type II/IV secretion system protein [Planctomycetes bacterium]|nr:type II/IV secretion system protein [Planctomycetota bacterium]
MIQPEDVVIRKKSGEPAFSSADDSRIGLHLRRMIGDALDMRATDLHLEPDGAQVRVRARVDGFLRDVAHLDGDTGGRLVSAIKVLCDLDIAGRSPMQDGSFSASVKGKPIEMRVSTLEEIGGEKLALRILEAESAAQDMSKLGLSHRSENELKAFLARSQGMLVVSGPTGNGKSTTLHSMLRAVDRRRRNVIAIEDPVESRIEYVTHVAVNARAGTTFAGALRNALRQDPNVLMIGEIRDAETASIAIQSGLTGHLVLSTVHARDALGTVTRLADLGVEPHLIADVLNFALAQRLVRVLCPRCRRPVPERELRDHPLRSLISGTIFDAGRCQACGGSGYRGRVGVFELVKMTDRLRPLIAGRAPESELRKAAEADGAVPVLFAAMERVNEGVTSLEEVERVIG